MPAFAEPTTVDLSFKIDGVDNPLWSGVTWDSGYTARTGSTDEFTVKLSSANQQTTTITDVPVMKGGDVIFTMNEGKGYISNLTVNAKQWNTKAQTANISYSLDGTNFTTITGKSLSNFSISTGDLPDNVVAVKASFTNTSNQVGIASIVYELVSNDDTPDTPDIPKTPAEIIWVEDSCTATIGAENTYPEIVVEPEEALSEVVYTSSDNSVAKIDGEGKITLLKQGVVTITAAFSANSNYEGEPASYKLTVLPKEVPAGLIVDKITYEDFDFGSYVSTNSPVYKDATYTSSESGIVYAAQIANKTNLGKIQLRATAPSAIVTSENKKGHTLYAVEVEWDSESVAARQIDVYGNTDYYASGADLYDSAKHGTSIGSIINGTNTDVTYEGEEAFTVAGIRSNKSALFLTSITFYWVKNESETPVEPELADFPFEENLEGEFYAPENSEAIFNVTLPEGADGSKITWSIRTEDEEAEYIMFDEVADEMAEIMLFECGVYPITVSYAGDDNFAETSYTFDLRVHPDHLTHFALEEGSDNVMIGKQHLENNFYFKLPFYNEDYSYRYKITSSDDVEEEVVAFAAEDGEEDGWWDYLHENGIFLVGSNGSIDLKAIRNTVASPVHTLYYQNISNEETGVEAIVAEMEEGAIYDLQGRRVNGIAADGIYLVRQGNKVFKIMSK